MFKWLIAFCWKNIVYASVFSDAKVLEQEVLPALMEQGKKLKFLCDWVVMHTSSHVFRNEDCINLSQGS
jgi:hypothetical protein